MRIAEIALLVLAAVSAAGLIYMAVPGFREQEREPAKGDFRRPLALIVLLILSLSAAAFLFLNRRVEEAEDRLRAEIRWVSGQIDRSETSLRTELRTLEEQNNCFRSVRTEFVSLDPDAKTMELRVIAEPKYVTEGASVWLQLEDRELKLEQTEGRSFEAVFRTPADNWYESRNAVLMLIENGQARTQQAEISLSLGQNVFPHAYHGGAWRVEDGLVTGIEYEASVTANLYEVTGMYAELFRGEALLARKELVGPDRAKDLHTESYDGDQSFELSFPLAEPRPRSVLEAEESELLAYTVHLHFDDSAGLHHDSTKLILEVREPTRMWYLEPDYAKYYELTDDRWIVTNDAGELLYID